MPQFYTGDRKTNRVVGSFFAGLAVLFGTLAHQSHNDVPVTSSIHTGRGNSQLGNDDLEALSDARFNLHGLVPSSVSERLNSESIHELIAKDDAAYVLSEAPILAQVNVTLDEYDFVISPSEEDTQSVLARVDHAVEYPLGYSPLVIAVNDVAAQELEKRGIATNLGEQNYRVNVAALLELLDSGVTWGELGFDEHTAEPAVITVPDPDLTALATKWAQTVALAGSGAQGFSTMHRSSQWVESEAVRSIHYSIGDDPQLLMQRLHEKTPRMVVTTEVSAIVDSDSNGIGPVALMYPDIQLPAKYSFIALNEEANAFAEEYTKEALRPPFGAGLGFESVRYSPYQVERFVRERMGRMLPEESELGIRSLGDLAAARSFTSQAVPGDKRFTSVEQLERPVDDE